MTSVATPPKPKEHMDKVKTRNDNFWNQTIEQNNARLDGKSIPDDARDEIKFIQAALLTAGRPNYD